MPILYNQDGCKLRQNYAAGIRARFYSNPIDAVLRAYCLVQIVLNTQTLSPPLLQKKKKTRQFSARH